jgi:peptidoglycan/LPS O-acetylase OafA/YrhL
MAKSEITQRLHFLDGLRGLAAFYVLLFHETTTKFAGADKPSSGMRFLMAWFHEGHFAVVVFIVLSGFSLMLPIARADATQLIGPFAAFVRRRARRILPPYYASLALAIGLLVAYNALAVRFGLGKPVSDAALSTGSVVSHLLLVHNLNFDWAYRINGPAWSVATEWQIYFLFVLALLPLFRAVGLTGAVVVAWLVGAAPFYLLPADRNFFWACPWFIGSFALGMCGAVISQAPRQRASWWRLRAPWGWATLLLFVIVLALSASGLTDRWSYPAIDLWVSLLAFCLITGAATHDVRGAARKNVVLRLLESRVLVELGAFSYSLYLVQHPLLRLTEKVFARLNLRYDAYTLVQLLVGTPVVVGFAWLFSELFERPFTGGGLLLPALRGRSQPARAATAPRP